MDRRVIEDGDEVTYIGNRDVIRTNKYSWKEFIENQLIIGKKYKVISSYCAQTVFIKKDGEFVKDFSGERYLYWRIKDEFEEEIYVWEGFFEENTRL